MSPIIGDRYQCKNCTEKIGFDLCGDCFRTRPKLPGRFNQRHTPEHKLELIKPANIVRRYGRLNHGSSSFFAFDEASENLENGLVPYALSGAFQEYIRNNNLGASLLEIDSMEDEDEESDEDVGAVSVE